MNSIQYHIKQDGVWQKLNATPVFPFSLGELLDERLDEAYLTIYDSPDEHIPRLAEIRATIQNGNNTKQEYFIIASDTSVELPAGSGKYKHDIYLIERTKLLEGIFCSSLTFTNYRKIDYGKSTSALIEDLKQGDPDIAALSSYFPDPDIKFAQLLASPFYTNIPIPSSYDVAFFMSGILNQTSTTIWAPEEDAAVGLGEYLYTSFVYDGTSYLWNDTTTPELGDISQYLEYTICLNDGGGSIIFKFKVTFSAVSEKYPPKRWSITDCITRCCELAFPLFGAEKPKYRLDGVEYNGNGNVIKPYTVGSLAEKYDKVFAPEMTLTQDNLREQLRLIFSNVHAEPWIDENDIIHVTEYGGVTPSPSAELPYVYAAGKSHINEYCTEVRSHAQNLASSLGYAKGTMIDPGDGLYRSLRTDTAYARINEGNGVAKTPKPIYSIDKVMCGIAPANQSPGMSWWLDPVEITPYVFEATEYGANLSPYKVGYPYSRAYAIYYTMGQPNIQGLFYQAPDAVSNAVNSPFSIANILSAVTGRDADTIYNYLKSTVGGAADLVFSITYKPISNHFVSHGKSLYVKGETPFMQLYNQTENLVESQYYGEHIKGVAYRLGNVEEERTYILKDINDIPKVGQMLDEYAITAVSSEIFPFDIKCTVGLSKDYNALSSYIGINSAKRMYEISERQATQRDILYKETLVIGEKPTGYNRAGKMFNNLAPIYTLFDSNATNGGDWCISFAILHTEKKNTDPLYEVCLPVIGRALGNVLTFNFATKDNYSAGDSTLFIGGATGIGGRWQTDAPYSDFYGRAWWSDISLKTRFDGTRDDQIRDAFNIPQAQPSTGNYLYLDGHRLRKDNRETLSYNLELEIKTTDPNLIIGSALAELSGWVNETDVLSELYFFDAEKYSVSKFDKQYTPHDDDIRGYDYDSSAFPGNPYWSITNEADGTLNFRTVGQRINGHNVGFVLCTPIETVTETVENEDGEIEEITYQTGGDILLANNGPFAFGETISYDFYVTKN